MQSKEVQFRAMLTKDENGRLIIYPKTPKNGYIIESDEQLEEAKRAFFESLSNASLTSISEYNSKIDKIFENSEKYNKPMNRFLAFDNQAMNYSYMQIFGLLIISLMFVLNGLFMFINNDGNIVNKFMGILGVLFFGLGILIGFLLLFRKLYLTRKN